MKKVIGFIMIAIPFSVFLFMSIQENGLRNTAIIVSISISSAYLIIMGIRLLLEDE